MKRKQYASTHEEALDRMCYVCGELIPVTVTQEMQPGNNHLCAMAEAVKEKFSGLFGKYSRCHMLFNSSGIVDTVELSIAIKDFMAYWRFNWASESVTPKMHILEDHVVPFIKKWKLGCGFYGEQGTHTFSIIMRNGNRSVKHLKISYPLNLLKKSFSYLL